jgi:integral membrane sensor domain MASE1
MPARVLQREWLQLHSSEHASKWAVAVLYLAAYIILAWASFIHVHKGLPITPWDPGLGVAFALMIRGGPLSGLILFAGMVVAETFVLQKDVDWPIDIGVAAITALSYTSVAALLQRYFRIEADLTHLRDVLMLLAAGLAGAVLDTVLLSAFLLAVGQFDRRDVVQVARPLLIGDTIGIAVVTPLLPRFRVQERLKTQRLLSLAPEGALYFCIIGVALWLIIGSEGAHGFRLFYLLFVPVVIAAVRHGVDGACFSLAVTQFSLIGLLHFSGCDASEFTEFQTLVLVLTVTGLIVGVVISERKPVTPVDDLRQARELAMLICTSEEAIETFIAHCDVAARDLLLPYGDVVIVLSTVLRIKRTLEGPEIDELISDLQARKAAAVERQRRDDWRNRELAAKRFEAACHHVNDASMPHLAPDRVR